MQMAKTVCAVDLLRESGVPYVSVLAHPTTGGVIASFAALGDFVVAEPDALLSFAGPRVVQETTRETLPARLRALRVELRARPHRRRRQARRPQGRPRPDPAAVRGRHARADRARRGRSAAAAASSRACCASCARARTASRTRTAGRREQPPADAVPRSAPPARRARRRIGHLGCRPARPRRRAALHAGLREPPRGRVGGAARRPRGHRRPRDRRGHRLVPRPHDRDHRPPEGPRPQGARVPQLRHGAAAGLRQGAARLRARRPPRLPGRHDDRHARRLPRRRGGAGAARPRPSRSRCWRWCACACRPSRA